jgi:hypothetical protein
MKQDQFNNFMFEMLRESDRAAPIVGAAYMDDLLKEILKIRFVNPKPSLFEGSGALANFSSRIEISRCIGLIDCEFANKLNQIRSIRNDSAHKLVPFNAEEKASADKIRSLVEGLSKTNGWKVSWDTLSKINKNGSENSLKLKLAIVLMVANLADLLKSIKPLDSSAARSLVRPD